MAPARRSSEARLYALDGVTRSYEGVTVLDVARLDVFRGEVLGIVGPSGAGKSTLLRLLNMIEPPTGGDMRFDGHDASSCIPLEQRRRVTTVFQRPLLLNRSVRANVTFGLGLRGIRGQRERVDAALDRVGMLKLAHRRARALSGGEAQRVALARALVLDPDVLLLDEPTANLDPYNVGLIEEIVAALNRDAGTTIVLVTHNVFQARRLADRVALMLDGSLIEVAETDRFFEAADDPRTAAFVRGDMVY